MSGREQLVPLELGEHVRDVVTGREGAVLWIAPPGATRPSLLVGWDDGGRSAYGAEEVGGRLVRWLP